MPLQIHIEQADSVILMRLHGRLIFGAESSQLQDAVQGLLSDGSTKVIIDLKEVPFIDSTGLGVLVVVHAAAQKADGAVRLLHVSERHMELLVLTRLSTLFQMFDDEGKAVDSFFPDRAVKHFDILEFVQSQENETEDLGDSSDKPTGT